MAGSTTPAQLRIGVVLEAFLDRPLADVLAWLAQAAPEVTDIEAGAGRYAPHPHCDVAELLHSAQARAAWLDLIARHGLRLDALNAWGNPLHPDEDLARRHDEDLRNAIRLAVLLGADRVVAMAGCPAGAPGDGVPHFDRRWPEPADQMPWTFAVPGRGHDLAWWTGLVRALAGSRAQVMSIEHEDPFVPAETGVPEAARVLRAAIHAARTVAA